MIAPDAADDAHVAVIETHGAVPSEVAVGAKIALAVSLKCTAGCDLSGTSLTVTGPDGAVSAIAPGEDGDGGPRSIVLTAPCAVGEHAWRIAAAPHEAAGIRHRAETLTVGVRTRPHETSLAVWAMPSPVETGRCFAVKVGAKSTSGCALAGCTIEVRDENDAALASGCLGGTPWPGTSALYWTELTLPAPAAPGLFAWSVRVEAADLALPHKHAAARFSIAVVPPPEHRLTVKVIEQETAAPIEGAQVRLGAYRAATGQSGLAEIMMPKGTYDLNVWKPGYEAAPTTVAIDADLTVEIAVAAAPEENPDSAWLM